jgi:hypothetical protein
MRSWCFSSVPTAKNRSALKGRYAANTPTSAHGRLGSKR